MIYARLMLSICLRLIIILLRCFAIAAAMMMLSSSSDAHTLYLFTPSLLIFRFRYFFRQTPRFSLPSFAGTATLVSLPLRCRHSSS